MVLAGCFLAQLLADFACVLFTGPSKVIVGMAARANSPGMSQIVNDGGGGGGVDGGCVCFRAKIRHRSTVFNDAMVPGSATLSMLAFHSAESCVRKHQKSIAMLAFSPFDGT